MRKALVNKAYRHEVNGVLKQAVSLLDAEQVEDAGDEVRSIGRSDWKKVPDAPLGEIVKEKIQKRVDHTGRGKSLLKASREFAEALEVEIVDAAGKWAVRATDYPHLIAYGAEKAEAVEALRQLAELAKRNELGAHYRTLIDGEFVTPTLSNE